ncbi:hypothetical protein D1872_267310 [compost metagenome]
MRFQHDHALGHMVRQLQFLPLFLRNLGVRVVQVQRIHAEVRAHNLAVQQQIVDRPHHLVDRDGKAEPLHAGIRNLHRVDADQPAVQIDERSAAVAFVNGRVGLNDLLLPVVDPVLTQGDRNHPARIADNARG